MLKIYLGYDPREHEAYEVAAYSIRRRATRPVLITPLYSMNPLYERGWHRRNDGQRVDDIDGNPFSTEFSFARFLVPACERYVGWALFADCDFLFLEDVAGLDIYKDIGKAVAVVKHQHRPSETVKMDGQAQSRYPRKNWSSLILWNCGHPANAMLTPDVVNSATGAYLHGFKWLEDGDIGTIQGRWNHLVGYDPPVSPVDATALHFTQGGPWLEKYKDCPYADLWRREKQEMLDGLDTHRGSEPSQISRQGREPDDHWRTGFIGSEPSP